MEFSRLQAQAEDRERKVAETAWEVATAKNVALSEYQHADEFEQVCVDNYEEGVRTFMYNVWCEHPKWDLSFLGEAAREMITEFNVPPGTPLNDRPVEFMPLADQSPQVADQPPQVINEDFPAVYDGGGGGADEDGEVVSSEDHPSGRLN